MSANPTERPLAACPVSGSRGRLVRLETLRSLLKPEARSRIAADRYRFCADPDCDVVYFAEDGSPCFTRADLKVRVGIKETAPPRPLCYCFHYSIEDIFTQIQETGATTIPDEIRRRLDTDGCDCVHTNPQGSCCLGTVLSITEQGLARFHRSPPPKGDQGEG